MTNLKQLQKRYEELSREVDKAFHEVGKELAADLIDTYKDDLTRETVWREQLEEYIKEEADMHELVTEFAGMSSGCTEDDYLRWAKEEAQQQHCADSDVHVAYLRLQQMIEHYVDQMEETECQLCRN